MKAMVLRSPAPVDTSPLRAEDVDLQPLRNGDVRLRVLACGVCRTDLHIVEGELPAKRPRLVPGHQLVGEIIQSGTTAHRVGARVGVSWLGGTDGTCSFCVSGLENLCDHPTFTGYDRDGGYAEMADARGDFVVTLPPQLGALDAAPLLCAGIIGFRALRVAGVTRGERVGLFGFGASAHLAAQVLKHWECEVFVSTRGASHRKLAQSLGVSWVGDATERPPELLDRAITFAPAGEVVIAALSSLRKGGVVAINAIHLDRMPQFDYDALLWGERQLRSVANMTRQDARDFVALAAEIPIESHVQTFPLAQANEALRALKNDEIDGAAVLIP
jgi:propanol-preferring alcohol dehydrogenase